MKNQKGILFLAAILAMVMLAGCTKDNNGTDPTRDSYLGTWSVSETHTKLAYEVTIIADPNSSDGVLISCFANTLPSQPYAGATISGSRITLDQDQVIGDGIKVAGYGSLSGDKITWNYTIDDGADLIHAVAIYSKLSR